MFVHAFNAVCLCLCKGCVCFYAHVHVHKCVNKCFIHDGERLVKMILNEIAPLQQIIRSLAIKQVIKHVSKHLLSIWHNVKQYKYNHQQNSASTLNGICVEQIGKAGVHFRTKNSFCVVPTSSRPCCIPLIHLSHREAIIPSTLLQGSGGEEELTVMLEYT